MRVAIIAAVAAILGAAASGITSYLIATKQIDSQASEDRANFLRQQRQSAYASVLSTAAVLQKNMNEFAVQRATGTTQLAVTSTTLENQLVTFANSIGNVRIIGSSATVAAAQDLLSGLEALQSDVELEGACNNGADKLQGNQCASEPGKVRDESSAVADALDRFIVASRRDVGN